MLDGGDNVNYIITRNNDDNIRNMYLAFQAPQWCSKPDRGT